MLAAARPRRIGFEVTRTDQPRMTPSVRVALADLALDHVYLVHAGDQVFPVADRVTAVAAGPLLAGELAILS